MSLGTHKGLDATASQPADHSAATAQPKWDVSHREVLNQIKQDRGAHPEVKVAVATVPAAQQQHREVPHPPTVPHPPVAQVARPDVAHVQPGVGPGARPDQHIGPRGQGAQWNQHPARPEVPQQIAQGHGVGNQQISQNQAQHPTEINRTVINNNQRYEYGNNGQHGNNNYKYVYGGLAGGALAGGAAAYLGREHAPNQNYAYNNYRNWNTYNQYNTYDQYNAYDQYNTYNNYDQYALSNLLGNQLGGYDQYDSLRYPNGDYDDIYASNDAIYDPSYAGRNNLDYLYGGTTYGGTQFDSGYNRPIYETTVVDSYRPIYRESDPSAIVPQLFGNLFGGIIGAITSSNHHKRYYNQFDC
ncbi:MAG TPA: hypothetical protein V6C89_14575 [Drouetiella sp.]|jgi:hypothetical protein